MLKSLKTWNQRRLDARRVGKQTANYRDWIKKNRCSPTKGGSLRVSFVIPIWQAPATSHLAMIESIESQTIKPHQIFLFAANDNAEETITEIRARLGSASQLTVVPTRKEQSFIERLTAAAKLCDGKWLCVATKTGDFAMNASAWVSHVLEEEPSLRMIYGDEDELNRSGERINPCFKPDLNRDLLLSGDHLGNPVFIERDLLTKVLSKSEKQPAANVYHLYLRTLSMLADHEVGHIPVILFHRHHEKKSQATQKKWFAQQEAATAIELHLHEHHKGCRVTTDPLSGVVRTIWPIPEELPLVSIIVPTRNGQELVHQLITSLIGLTTYSHYEILLVDNNSDDPSALEYFDSLQTQGFVRLIKDPGDFNYSRINNAAVSQASGELILLLNNDIEILRPDWLTEMVSHVLRPGVGCVGARLLYPDNTIQHAGVIVGLGGLAGHVFCGLPGDHGGYFNRAQSTQEMSALTAASLLIKRSVFDAVGGLDEALFAVAYNDVDLCLKVREAGFRNIYTPHAVLRHHESATRGPDTSGENLKRFRREGKSLKEKWGSLLLIDPMYNPNLAMDTGHFAIAERTRSWSLRKNRSD